MKTVTLLVNGTERKVEAEAGEPLLSVLRNRLGLTGTKYGCGEGQCGACTVLIDGRAVRSCRMPAESAAGRKIVTIESLGQNGKLHPLQQAFLEEEAFQCGYCTPGMIMAAHALLTATPRPSDEDILQHMNGNVCRCGTYPRIMAAIRRAGRSAGGEKKS
jgi:aerobic-type carbon monoxide dehydrogenase small subunit (CoxS/CutS family)